MSDNLYDGLKTFHVGNNIYISVNDAVLFIQRCKDKNIAIIGFDGIYCKEGQINPDLNLIADFSKITNDDDFKEKSYSSALKVLSDFPKSEDLYIDFIIRK